MVFKIEISDTDILLNDPTSLLWKTSVLLTEHATRLQSCLIGKPLAVGDFKGTILSVAPPNIVLENSTKQRKCVRVPAKRLLQLLPPVAVTTRK